MVTALERAARVREIRVALEMNQSEFAARLNAAALDLGLDVTYTHLSVSQRETARLQLDIEDFVVISHVDPHHRDILWLAFGRTIPLSKRLRGMAPRPPTKGGASGEGAVGPKKRDRSR